MDVSFVHYSKLYFDENYRFTIEFKDKHVVGQIIFGKSKDYYINNMTCYIIHEITTNKHVLELSKLANEIDRLKQYPIPNFVWVHYNDIRLFNHYQFPLLRTKLWVDHSISEIYTNTYSYYDTTEKKFKSFKFHNLYNEIFASHFYYRAPREEGSIRSYRLSLDGNKFKKIIFNDDRQTRNVYHQLNSIYSWDPVYKKFIKSNSGWVDDYLRLLRTNKATGQRLRFVFNEYVKKEKGQSTLIHHEDHKSSLTEAEKKMQYLK